MSLVLSPFLLGLAFLVLVLTWLSWRTGSPVVAIFTRWSRWLFIAAAVAWMNLMFGFIDREIWVVGLAAFVLWPLLETTYHWLAISALSHADLPLFPRFRAAERDEWPNQTRFIRLREWLRSQGFRHRTAAVGYLDDDAIMRVSLYEDEARTIRLQVVFLPHFSGAPTVCLIATSTAADGTLLFTDNLFLPFGGFYPENWLLARSPWRRSPRRLLALHRRRMARLPLTWEAQEEDPVEELNRQQQRLERINLELGFLTAHEEREERGKITREGRYRIWSELWLLNYLGRPRSY